MTGGTIDKDNPTGVLAVLANGNTIDVSADGIAVNQSNLDFPVDSVNGEVGTVVLDASDVGAIADDNGSYTNGLSGDTITLSGDATVGGNISATDATVGGNLEVTGTSTLTGNVTLNNNLTATGNITASSFIGDGSQLTGIIGSTVGNTAPNNPLPGDLWWNAVVGIMYVWFVDEDQTSPEGQWVDVRPPSAGGLVTSVNGMSGAVTLNAASVGALSTSGGVLGGPVSGTSFSAPTFKLTGFADNAVPYVASDGTITAMSGVEYNADTQTLKVTKLESPSTGDIILNAEFQATGPVDFTDTLTVNKATALNSTLNVTGVSTLSDVSITGGVNHLGDSSITGDVGVTGTVTASAFVGDGSQLTNLPIPASTTFKGAINATTGTAPSAVDGDVYSNTTAGTAASSYTGNRWIITGC